MREPCSRCNGTGMVVYKLGYPGQDRRVIPYTEIKWLPPTTERCPVCKGMKKKPLPTNYPPPRTEIYWNTPLTDEEMDAMVSHHDVPMEVYDDEQ